VHGVPSFEQGHAPAVDGVLITFATEVRWILLIDAKKATYLSQTPIFTEVLLTRVHFDKALRMK
jgi:hypothetical protein